MRLMTMSSDYKQQNFFNVIKQDTKSPQNTLCNTHSIHIYITLHLEWILFMNLISHVIYFPHDSVIFTKYLICSIFSPMIFYKNMIHLFLNDSFV